MGDTPLASLHDVQRRHDAIVFSRSVGLPQDQSLHLRRQRSSAAYGTCVMRKNLLDRLLVVMTLAVVAAIVLVMEVRRWRARPGPNDQRQPCPQLAPSTSST